MVKKSDPKGMMVVFAQVAWLQSLALDQWARGWTLLSLLMARLSGRGARFNATILFQ